MAGQTFRKVVIVNTVPRLGVRDRDHLGHRARRPTGNVVTSFGPGSEADPQVGRMHDLPRGRAEAVLDAEGSSRSDEHQPGATG